MPELSPPPLGWTLAEAAAALLPDLYAAASRPIPADWWMAGGGEPHRQERDALRLALARILEAGDYEATGIQFLKSEPTVIAPHLWRAAVFRLGLPREPIRISELTTGAISWDGVRVQARRSPVTLGPGAYAIASPAPMPPPAPPAPVVSSGAWWTAEQALSWIAFGLPLRWEDARQAAGAPADNGERMAQAQRQLSDAIAARRLPAWGQETADMSKPPLRDTLVPIPPEDFAGPAALTVQGHGYGWAFPPRLGRRYEGRWWQGISFEAADVRRAFPAAEPKAEAAAEDNGAAPPEITSTGAPGRPTSMHLILPEHRRRLDAGEAHDAVAEEARHLAAWFAEAHRNAPQPTAKTIENAIRAAHRQRPTRPPK